MAEPVAGNDKSELKRLLKVASSHPVHMAMAIGPDGKPIMRMDKTKNAKALEKMIRAESPSAKDVRFGSVSVDPSETTEATFMLNKALGGAARKLAVFLKPAGISKVHIVLEDGTAAESASDEEAPAAGAMAGGAADAAAMLAGGAAAGGAMGAEAAGAATGVAGGAMAGGAMAAGAAAGGAVAGAAMGQHGHKGHNHGRSHADGHGRAHPAQGQPPSQHAGEGAAGQVVKGKDAAAGPNAIPALSDADFSKLMKAIQAELVHLHHSETGPIKAVPPAGSAAKPAQAADGAQPEKAKPVVKLSDADFAKLQELAKAGHFTLMPADAAPKAPEGKDATSKDATSKDATGKEGAGKDTAGQGATGKDTVVKTTAGLDAAHPIKAPGSESAVAKDAKGTGADLPGGAHPNAAHPDPAHPGAAMNGMSVPHRPDAAPNAGAGGSPDGNAPAGQDSGAMTGAKLTKDLTALVKRLMAVVKQNPSQQAELSRLAIDAQGSIRANDLESAAATMQVLMMSLDAAAGEVPAMADVQAKVNQEWETLRAHIEADLEFSQDRGVEGRGGPEARPRSPRGGPSRPSPGLGRPAKPD